MKRKETIKERLAKLNRELDFSLGKRIENGNERPVDNLRRLIDMGLTSDEAEAWLEQERNFVPSDDSYHEPSNRRKVTRTLNIHVPFSE